MSESESVNKWISTKGKHGKPNVFYHTVEDCRYLQDTKNYRPAVEEELEWHDADECGRCKELREEE